MSAYASASTALEQRRKLTSNVMLGLTIAGTILALIPLFAITAWTLTSGINALNLDFFTHTPKPAGEPGGGMFDAIVGTLILVGLATAIAVPVGVLAGVYLAEFGRNSVGQVIRFANDVLSGLPSITIGLFAYAAFVRPIGHFSAWSGAIALAIIMLPLIVRTTEEMLNLVPRSLREGALALGSSKWRALATVILPSAFTGILTGVMLGIARAAGETAPLLFTAFGKTIFSDARPTFGLNEPIAAMPLQIYTYAKGPYESEHQLAWAAAFVLVMLVLVINILVRALTSRRNP